MPRNLQEHKFVETKNRDELRNYTYFGQKIMVKLLRKIMPKSFFNRILFDEF